jgi:hypothetical protein
MEENGIRTKPVPKQGIQQKACTLQAAPDRAKAGGSDQDKKRAKHQNGAASASTKAPKTVQEQAHHRLSFGEELEEEEASPSAAFSLGQSTANRFQEERRHWVPGSTHLPPGPVEAAIASASQEGRKRLGPIACGVAQTRGPRPYMVCPSPYFEEQRVCPGQAPWQYGSDMGRDGEVVGISSLTNLLQLASTLQWSSRVCLVM